MLLFFFAKYYQVIIIKTFRFQVELGEITFLLSICSGFAVLIERNSGKSRRIRQLWEAQYKEIKHLLGLLVHQLPRSEYMCVDHNQSTAR